MHNRLIMAGLAATGGLLTSAFLQVAVAAADVGADVSATGVDAFTIGGYTFDPFTAAGVEGFDPVAPLSSAPPLLAIGGGDLLGILPVASQNFEVYSPTGGADLGNIDTSETVTNLLGLTNTEFTVIGSTAAAGGTASALPTTGSVYDVFNLGNGYENVYTAIPGAAGAGDTVTDTLVTPTGNINLDSLFGSIDAAAPLQPGDALADLGDSALGKDAFTFGSTTFDPYLTDPSTGAVTGEGFAPVTSLVSAPPLLNIGGAELGGGFLNTQDFNVYDGTGAGATEVGTVQTGVEVTNLLGLNNTEFTVQIATPASGESGAALPAVGTVYDSFNLGNGYDNLYIATPGTDGTVTDTLITPSGNIDLSSLFGSINAANPLQPGDAFTGLSDAAIGKDAFAIGGTAFDPMTTDTGGAATEGFTPVTSTIGVPPLLNLGGGTPSLDGITLPLAPQDFNVYDGTGAGATEVGSITTNEDVTNLLGLTNTEFTVTAVTPAADAGSGVADLPTVGSVYDVFNLGGLENVYTAIPGVAGAADTITDTLVTPFGNFDLSSLFAGVDAAAALDPGAAFGSGLDVVTSAASEAAAGAATAIDPLAFLGL